MGRLRRWWHGSRTRSVYQILVIAYYLIRAWWKTRKTRPEIKEFMDETKKCDTCKAVQPSGKLFCDDHMEELNDLMDKHFEEAA